MKKAQYIKVKTADYTTLVSVDGIGRLGGTSTTIVIDYGPGTGFDESANTINKLTIGGFTGATTQDGYQTLYSLMKQVGKQPNSIPTLVVNGDDTFTVAWSVAGPAT